MKVLKRIAVTGPESTGKTDLSRELADFFSTKYVEEYARAYLNDHIGDYSLEDILEIAKGQLKMEDAVAKNSSTFIFCDTDFTVLKIWCQHVFNSCPEWIDKTFKEHQYDLYLLCYPDIEWEADPLRENPDDRLHLFELYKSELDTMGFNYAVIKGKGKQRLENAINFVNLLNKE